MKKENIKKFLIFLIFAFISIVVISYLVKPIGFAYEIYIEQESDYTILNTKVGDDIPEDIKKQLIRYMQNNDLKILPGHYWISSTASFEQTIEKIEFNSAIIIVSN